MAALRVLSAMPLLPRPLCRRSGCSGVAVRRSMSSGSAGVKALVGGGMRMRHG
jgi:hypothetical protein